MNVKIASILSLGMLMVSSAGAGMLFSQAPDEVGNWASQNDTSTGGLGNFASAYGDFILGSSSSVNQVGWTGGYFNPPAQATIAGFTLDFYGDNSGQAGTLLASDFISGTAGETFVGHDSFGDLEYSYSSALPTSFSAAAGTKYWLSIVPDMPETTPQWGWGTSGEGDNSAYATFFGSQIPKSNFAFTLEGTASVPDGGTTSLFLGLALAGLGFARRKLC
jgi:hypothetical protein